VYNAILRHNTTKQAALARAGASAAVPGSSDAIVADLALARRHLHTRVVATHRPAVDFRPRKETMDDTKAIGMRGHILRHLTALGVMDGDRFLDAEWHTLVARERDRQCTSWSPVLSTGVHEQLVLFQHVDVNADARFLPPVILARDLASYQRVAKFTATLTEERRDANEDDGGDHETTLRWRVPVVEAAPAPPSAVALETTLPLVVTTIEATTRGMFESFLRLVHAVQDDAFAHNVLLTLFMRQRAKWGLPDMDLADVRLEYQRKLQASRLLCIRELNAKLQPPTRALLRSLISGDVLQARDIAASIPVRDVYTAQLYTFCVDEHVSPVRLCDGYFAKSIQSVFTASLYMIGDNAWDTAERIGVRGALELAAAKDIAVPAAVRDTFRVLLDLPNAAARTARIDNDTRARILRLLSG
jgi:hypothetical protein